MLQDRAPPRSTRASISLLGLARQLQAEGHVVGDRHVRIERVALEHHGDAALGRRQVVDHAGRRCMMSPEVGVSRPAIMRSSVDLPQPEGPTQHDELAVGDVEVDALEHVGLCRRTCGPVDLELGHDGSPYLTAPEVMPRISCREKMR